MKQFNTILRLRRDNDFNYEKVKSTFIPANGEICLVDTASTGLRVICGDGKSTYENLSYVDGTLLQGYFYGDVFYADKEHTKPYDSSKKNVYIDLINYNLYIFDGTNFQIITEKIPTASEKVVGGMKLYNTIGENTDGTMTQKAISDELNEKIEMAVNEQEETLKLGYDII